MDDKPEAQASPDATGIEAPALEVGPSGVGAPPASHAPDLLILEWIGGYEDKTQPVEVPPFVLVAAARAIRELRADFDQVSNVASGCVFCDSPWLEAARARWAKKEPHADA